MKKIKIAQIGVGHDHASQTIRTMRDFAAMVRGDRKNEYSFDYEEKLHALILKACGA